ncbi:MAG: glycosyltransferase family 4 protein [Marinoscillum sp.]
MSKKILFLSPYPFDRAPSQRLKYEQYYPYFEKAGYELTTSSFISESFWKIVYKKGYFFSKVIFTFSGYFRRFFDLLRIRRYDIVYVHLWLTPIGPPVMEWLVARLAKRIIYDIDDLIYLNDQRNQNKIMTWIKGRRKPIELMKTADHVICCTPKLEEFVKQYNECVTDISSTINTDTYQPIAGKSKKPLVIGWSGSHSTSRYLHLLDEVFRQLSSRIDFTLKVIGDPTFTLDGVKVNAEAWERTSEVADLQGIDIGLYPLPLDEEWVYGKSGLKALQYMALGIPTIATAVGANYRIIEEGVNGFLVSTTEEWLDIILKLANDQELYDRIGVAARQTVIQQYSLKSTYTVYLSILEEN